LVKYARRRGTGCIEGRPGPNPGPSSQPRQKEEERKREERETRVRDGGEKERAEEEVQDTSREEVGGRRVYIARRAPDGLAGVVGR
jgi:hypothetical protein